jgi:hypothetical protein
LQVVHGTAEAEGALVAVEGGAVGAAEPPTHPHRIEAERPEVGITEPTGRLGVESRHELIGPLRRRVGEPFGAASEAGPEAR